jgi:hypothetical protein
MVADLPGGEIWKLIEPELFKMDFLSLSLFFCWLKIKNLLFQVHRRKLWKGTGMNTNRNNNAEPDYFRNAYPDNEPLYCYGFDVLFPLYCYAYRFEDERKEKYSDYASNLVRRLFGTESNLKKSYLLQY